MFYNSVRLEWQDTGALEYILEAGSAAGLSNLYTASVGSRAQFDAIVPRGLYFVRVRGRYANGLSDPSNEVVVDVFSSFPASQQATRAGAQKD